MCNQSNRWARCQQRVTSRPGSLKTCEEQPALAFCHIAKLSVSGSHNLCLWVLFTVVCQVTSSIRQPETPAMSKASAKTVKGESRFYRLCVPPCPYYITSGDTPSLCMVCLGAKLSLRRELSPVFLMVLALLPPRRSSSCTRGVRSWTWQREWRQASRYLLPHLPDSLPALWDRKPGLQFLLPEERALRFSYLPPRRLMWRALRIRPLSPPSMRSYWR